MKRLYLYLSISFLCPFSSLGQSPISQGQSITNQWNDVTYLTYTNFRMRVTTFEKPIVLEWGRLPSGTFSKEETEKLKCLSVKKYFSDLDLDHAMWKTYCSEEYINILKMDKEKFDKKKEVDIRKYPDYQFQHVFYWIDYLIDGKQYCLVVCNYQRKRVEKLPKHMKEYGKEHGISGSILLKQDGRWKNHAEHKFSYPGVMQFSDLEELLRIEKVGFVIDGVEHPRPHAVMPSKELRQAVGKKGRGVSP